MRKAKRIISLLVCAVMLLSTAAIMPVFAEDSDFVYKTQIEYNMKNAVTNGKYRGESGPEATGIGDMHKKFILFKNVDFEKGADYMDIGYATTYNQVVGVVIFDTPIETSDNSSVSLNNTDEGTQKTVTYKDKNGQVQTINGTTLKEYTTASGEIPITESFFLKDKTTFRVKFNTRQTGNKAVLLYTRSALNVYTVEFNIHIYKPNTEYNMKDAVTTGKYKGETGAEATGIGDTCRHYILFKEVDFENGCDMAEIGYAYQGFPDYTMNMYVFNEAVYSGKTNGDDFNFDDSTRTLTYTDYNGTEKTLSGSKLGDINITAGNSWNLIDKKIATVKFNEMVTGYGNNGINATKSGKRAVLIWCGPANTNVYTVKFGTSTKNAYEYNSVKNASSVGNKENAVLLKVKNEQYFLDTGNGKYAIYNNVDFGTDFANKIKISYGVNDISNVMLDIAVYDNPIVDTDTFNKENIESTVKKVANSSGTEKGYLSYQRFNLPQKTDWETSFTEEFTLEKPITGVKSVIVCTNSNLFGVQFGSEGFTNNTVTDKVWNINYKNNTQTQVSFIAIKALFKGGVLDIVEFEKVDVDGNNSATRKYDLNDSKYSDYDEARCMIFDSWENITPLADNHIVQLK